MKLRQETLKQIGYNCKMYRISRNILQKEVAVDTGYSVENVSAFENGRNSNVYILLWYILQGMDVNDLMHDVL